MAQNSQLNQTFNELCHLLAAQIKQLEKEKADFQAEKKLYEQMISQVNAAFERQTVNGSSGILKLNVGGVHYATTVDTLRSCPNTFLDCVTSDGATVQLDSEGRLFIDRNGELFAYILDFLRTGTVVWPTDESKRNMLLAEIEFYGLQDKMRYDNPQVRQPSLLPFTITMSSQYHGTANTVESLHDTNLTIGCGTNNAPNEYILCTFPSQCTVTGVKVGPLIGWSASHINNVVLEYSTDGSNFETVMRLSGINQEIVTFPFAKDVNATYWRLSKRGYIGVGYLEFLSETSN